MYMFLMKTVGIMSKLDNFHMISAAIMNSKTNLAKYFLNFKPENMTSTKPHFSINFFTVAPPKGHIV